MNILVADGAGYIGSHPIQHVIGQSVIAQPVLASLRLRVRFHTLKLWKP